MKEQQPAKFTSEEITFVRNVLSQQTVNPMSPNAVETVKKLQTIVRKMEEHKEQNDGE
jgi:hypothetical protein